MFNNLLNLLMKFCRIYILKRKEKKIAHKFINFEHRNRFSFINLT